MQSIHPDQLATVFGGEGEAAPGGGGAGLLGGLIGQAPGILNGIASIIGAAKSRGGGGGAPPAQAAPPEAAQAAAAAAAPGALPTGNPRVSVTVGRF